MYLSRVLFSSIALLVLACSLQAEPTKVSPNRNWVAVLEDESLKKHAPKQGIILEAKSFEKLWKAWRKDEKVPAVDFSKEFVVVVLAGGPNRPSLGATLDQGKLHITAAQTLIGGEGFGYALATFNRKGVKSVVLNNKEQPLK